MLKLPQNREIEIEIGTGEVEAVSPGRYASVDRGNLGRPRTRVGQSSAPPPAFRSAPPPAFRSAPPQAFVPQHVQHYPQAQAPEAYVQPSYPPAYGQAAYGQPSYSQPPPPPVPWAPAYASAQYPASVPSPPSSLAAIADPTSQYAAMTSTSSSRKGSPSGMVWAATLVVMGAFLGAMYGVYMRAPAPAAAAAASLPAAPQAVQPAQAAQAVAPVAPIAPVAQPAAVAVVAAPHASLVGVVGPASPVVVPVKPVEEPVVASTKGKHGAQGRHAAAPAGNHRTGGSASVAAAVPVKKPVGAPAAAQPSKGTKGKSAEELAAEKTLRDMRDQQSL